MVEPKCRMGYTEDQLRLILGDSFEHFFNWMGGQTMALCNGKKYSYDAGEYVESCGGVAHGMVVYRYDLQRYLDGFPVID